MPENAFLIGGHGANNDIHTPTFIVPPGCVVVALAHMGERTFTRGEANGRITRFCSLPTDVLKNPMEHTVELTDTFKPWGSLAFYTEGHECPNFVYSLVASHDTPEGFLFEAQGSGLIDVDKLKLRCTDLGPDIDKCDWASFQLLRNARGSTVSKRTTTDDVIEFIAEQFENSVHPSREDVRAYLGTNEGRAAIGAYGSVRDCVRRGVKFLKHMPMLRITQKALCSVTSGVFYNIVCRSTGVAMFPETHNATNLRYARNSALNYHSATEAQRAHMRAHISEAVLHRRPAIRNYYQSKKFRATRASKRRNIPFVSFKGRRTTVRNHRKR